MLPYSSSANGKDRASNWKERRKGADRTTTRSQERKNRTGSTSYTYENCYHGFAGLLLGKSLVFISKLFKGVVLTYRLFKGE